MVVYEQSTTSKTNPYSHGNPGTGIPHSRKDHRHISGFLRHNVARKKKRMDEYNRKHQRQSDRSLFLDTGGICSWIADRSDTSRLGVGLAATYNDFGMGNDS